MPAKLSTIAYVHETTECLTQDFTVKEITAVSRLSDEDPTKVVYLKVNLSDREIETQIEEFDTGDVTFLRGKFIACAGWYSVSMVIHFDSFCLETSNQLLFLFLLR